MRKAQQKIGALKKVTHLISSFALASTLAILMMLLIGLGASQLFGSTHAHADVCLECKKLRVQENKELAELKTYQDLKKRNEDYLKGPNVSSSAMIKVQSNLLLINIKIETANNRIEAIMLEKRKFEGCTSCPV